MGQEQGYTSHNDFQVLEFCCSFWLFQNLQTKYVSKSVRWNLSDGRNAHEHSTFINPSNSSF